MYRVSQILKHSLRSFTTSASHYGLGESYEQFLRNCYPATYITKLKNGFSIGTSERANTSSVCIGIFVDAGSRYENPFENGIVHFFEHMAFKGSRKWDKATLETQLSCMGATFKCITTRQMAGYYVQCLAADVAVAFDILTECIFQNLLNESEVEYQKKIVYEEMEKHDQDSNKILDDYLHAAAFQGTPLAQTVMGPSSNLNNFKSELIRNFMRKNFTPRRTVLAAAGGVPHKMITAMGESFFDKMEGKTCEDMMVYRYTGSDVRYRDDSQPLANVAMAVEGPALCEDDYLVMEIARFAVGGWDRSQPSGKLIADRLARDASTHHLADSCRSFNITYNDTSLWGCQFLSDAHGLDTMSSFIQEEWMHVCTTITQAEVDRAKNFYMTRILSRAQHTATTCYEIGRWLLYNDCHPSLASQLKVIGKITADQMREVCSRYIYNKCLTVAAVGACEGLLEYNRLRGNMYWLRR